MKKTSFKRLIKQATYWETNTCKRHIWSVKFSCSVVSDSLWPHGPGFPVYHQLLKLMSIELVMPSNHFILCHPLLLSSIFPSVRVFASGGQSIGASASASVLPVNIQGWFPLELTGLISLQSKGFSRVFPSTAIGRHQFFSAQPSFYSISHIHTWQLEEDLHVWWPESSRDFFTYVSGTCLG